MKKHVSSGQDEGAFFDSPSVWFVDLEIAREQNDFERAADAVRQLRRLGVEVRFRPPERSKKEANRDIHG